MASELERRMEILRRTANAQIGEKNDDFSAPSRPAAIKPLSEGAPTRPAVLKPLTTATALNTQATQVQNDNGKK